VADETLSVDGHPFVRYAPDRVPTELGVERLRSFHDDIQRRRSVRLFSDDPVPREMIELGIRTASSAPSGAHKQPWTFVAVSDPRMKLSIRQAAEREERRSYEGRMSAEWLRDLAPLGTDADKPFLQTAPWLVVVFMQRYGVGADGAHHKHYYTRESVGIACGFFIAAMHQAGLAVLTHTPSPMKFLADLLGRPGNEQAYMLFVVGYPSSDCVVPDLRRKSLSEVSVFVEAD
jgi:iodotyrosine deiodinase